MKNSNKKIKIQYYLISIWLVFILIFVQTIKNPFNYYSFIFFLKDNIIPLLSLIFIIGIFILAKLHIYELNGVHSYSYTITHIENKNFEYITFLTTIIIPLVLINLNNTRNIMILFILLIIIGIISTRTELYYGNPTLALFNYRLYEVELDNQNKKRILITKDKLQVETVIYCKEIDDCIWEVKKVKGYQHGN